MSERFDSSGGGTSVQDPLFNNETVTFTQIIGGNPNVAPEKADTLTFGVVLQPSFARGLSLSLDWYSIDVRGSIGQLGSQQIVTACFQGAKQLCDKITRDPLTNQITGLRNVFLNINAAKVSGTDLEIDYNAALGTGRSIGFRLLGSYLGENSITNLGVAKQDRASETGALSFPSYQAVASAIYTQGPFKVFLSERYIGSGKRRYNDNEVGGATLDVDRVSPAYYTDLQASYRVDLRNTSAVDVFANFTNVFDRDPPLAPNHTPFTGSVQTNAALFDVLGRRFVVGARFSF
jgi:outer membrane receptor protein involved in Fe transport